MAPAHLLLPLFSLFHFGRAQQTPYLPQFPVAVRSPYLSCWGTMGKPVDTGFSGTVPIVVDCIDSRQVGMYLDA